MDKQSKKYFPTFTTRFEYSTMSPRLTSTNLTSRTLDCLAGERTRSIQPFSLWQSLAATVQQVVGWNL